MKLATDERALFGLSLLIYVVLTLAIAVGPATRLLRTPPTPGLTPPSAQVEAGRKVYVAEGCSYCHTQQVRPLPGDRPFGRPSAPGDYVYDRPELLGSERTGPDLSDVGQRLASDAWHLIHLYEPRAVTPWSVMPAFHWLFTIRPQPAPGEVTVALPPAYAPSDGTVVATQRALDLVAYLRSLKQVPIGHAEAGTAIAKAVPGAAPAVTAPASFAWQQLGEKVYVEKCAACHQVGGQGIPSVFPPLKGNPAVLANDPAEHLHAVLFGLVGKPIDGVVYPAAMPPWDGQLSDEQIAAVVDYERRSWGNNASLVTPGDVKVARGKK